MKHKLIYLLMLFAVAFIIGTIAFGREMELTAAESVKLVSKISQLNTQNDEDFNATLRSGETVRVTACRNLKDDQVYKVITSSGIEGYVARGKFKITKKTLLESSFFNIVYCY